MGFEVLTAMSMSMMVFWVVSPCGLVTNVSEEHSASIFRAEATLEYESSKVMSKLLRSPYHLSYINSIYITLHTPKQQTGVISELCTFVVHFPVLVFHNYYTIP
jgi:predicted permease